jgi:hypothetical protein
VQTKLWVFFASLLGGKLNVDKTDQVAMEKENILTEECQIGVEVFMAKEE